MKLIRIYSIAVALIVAVTLLKYSVRGLGDHTPTLMYHVVIIVSAIFLGTGPAILALILSAGVIDYLFMHRAFYPDYHWSGILQSVIFIIDGVIIIWLISRLRTSEQALRDRSQKAEESTNRLTNILSRALDASSTRKRDD